MITLYKHLSFTHTGSEQNVIILLQPSGQVHLGISSLTFSRHPINV